MALARDGVFLAVVAVFLSSGLAYRFGSLSWNSWYATCNLLTALAILLRPRLAESDAERRFWNLIAIAFAFWFITTLTYDRFSIAVNVVNDVLYIFFYLVLIFAAETRPDIHRKVVGIDRVRGYDLAGLTLFAVGLLTYASLVPGALYPETYITWIPSTYLYIVLDLYMALHYALLSHRSPNRRWRTTYLLFALSACNWIVTDTIDVMSYYPDSSISTAPTLVHILWVTPFLLFVTASRLERVFPGKESSEAELPMAEPEASEPPQLVPLAFYALIFPFLHLLLNSKEPFFLNPELRPPRDGVTLVYISLAIFLAVRQRRILQQRQRALETDQRLLEQQFHHREKMVALGQLAAGVAHEVGNPLNSIAALTQHLQRRLDDPWAVGKLARVGEQIERIAALLQEMRDLARPPQRERGYVALDELIHSTVELMRFDQRADGVEITLELDRAVPAVHAIADQISQVFFNLAINALDALEDMTDPRPPRLVIRSRRVSSQGIDLAEVIFEDNGPGMTPEVEARLFEPWFSTKTVESASGMGLGLVVGRRILEEHGGSITAQNNPSGVGASLILRLPMSAPD